VLRNHQYRPLPLTRHLKRIIGDASLFEEAIHVPGDMRTDGMSDNPHKTDYRDRDRINVHQDHELRYWSKELGVTPEILKDTVQEVGVMATDVRRELNKDT
jgi:hypothetical protein